MLTRPIVVLRPVRPHHEAGSRTEPPVSVPIAPRRHAGGDRDAGAAARPAGGAMRLEVPRVPRRARDAGWCPSRPSQTRPYGSCRARSCPARRSARAKVAVAGERRSRHTIEPPVVTRPSMSIRSFSAIGTPCSGPTAWPARIALSAASAASRASSP